MPRIELTAAPARSGSGYPPPFDAPCATRTRRRLGAAGGLADFGVNLMTLPPGAWLAKAQPTETPSSTVFLATCLTF